MYRSQKNTSHPFLFLSLVLSIAACDGDKKLVVDASKEEANKTEQSILFHGGTIYTGVEAEPTTEAVAISNGKIIATGSLEDLSRSLNSTVEKIDLEGAVMFPGFVDAHAHFIGIGMRELTLNLEDVASIEGLIAAVAKNIKDSDETEVIYGRGWIETNWPENRMPNRLDLDAASSDIAIILERADGHAVVANSIALKMAGIDQDTPDPDGGRIEKDENGKPNGLLIDNASNLVMTLLATPDEDRKRKAYSEANRVYAEYGWTGLHNMSVRPENLGLIESLSDSGDVDIRVYNSVDPDGLDALIENGPRSSENGKSVTRAVKLYVDGALGSRGAALTEPYSDAPSTDGLLLMTEERALAQFSKARDAEIQVNTHAIGDRGNKLLLDWYQHTLGENPHEKDHRWRIEHSQILHVEDIPRFNALGVIPSMQPSHAIGDLYFAPDRLGQDRLGGAYAWRSLIDSGSIIAGGSDAPVERGDPRIEFYAAVARKDLEGNDGPEWNPAERVTRTEALKMFTLWPAIASFQEDDLGTIEVGKNADFSVFSKDLMTIDEAEILNADVVMTVVAGQVIYKRN